MLSCELAKWSSLCYSIRSCNNGTLKFLSKGCLVTDLGGLSRYQYNPKAHQYRKSLRSNTRSVSHVIFDSGDCRVVASDHEGLYEPLKALLGM